MKTLRAPVAVLATFSLFFSCLLGLALEEVAGPSRSLVRQFWISFAATACLGIAASALTWRPAFCARLADAEDALALRFRGRLSRRGFENRCFRVTVWIFFGLYAALTVLIGGAYLHFREM
jgi:hypothetical protein